MIVKLLTEHHFEFLSLKEAAQARLILHLSKCQIVGNLITRLFMQQLYKLTGASSSSFSSVVLMCSNPSLNAN